MQYVPHIQKVEKYNKKKHNEKGVRFFCYIVKQVI